MISRYIERLCKDFTKIENYELAMNDKSEMWVCHHKLEKYYSANELRKQHLYFHRPPEELIFMRKIDHQGNCDIHIARKIVSEETKRKMATARKGKKPFLGKHFTASAKKKISEAGKGRHWFHNETENIMAFECPAGYIPGRLYIRGIK